MHAVAIKINNGNFIITFSLYQTIAAFIFVNTVAFIIGKYNFIFLFPSPLLFQNIIRIGIKSQKLSAFRNHTHVAATIIILF